MSQSKGIKEFFCIDASRLNILRENLSGQKTKRHLQASVGICCYVAG